MYPAEKPMCKATEMSNAIQNLPQPRAVIRTCLTLAQAVETSGSDASALVCFLDRTKIHASRTTVEMGPRTRKTTFVTKRAVRGMVTIAEPNTKNIHS